MWIFSPYVIIILKQFYNSLQFLQSSKAFMKIAEYIYDKTNSVEVKNSKHILNLQFT